MSTRYFNYKEAHANTTLDFGTSGSILHAVTINNPGTTWVITITDGSGGAAIATIAVGAAPVTLFYDVVVNTGFHVTASGTAGSATFCYV